MRRAEVYPDIERRAVHEIWFFACTDKRIHRSLKQLVLTQNGPIRMNVKSRGQMIKHFARPQRSERNLAFETTRAAFHAGLCEGHHISGNDSSGA